MTLTILMTSSGYESMTSFSYSEDFGVSESEESSEVLKTTEFTSACSLPVIARYGSSTCTVLVTGKITETNSVRQVLIYYFSLLLLYYFCGNNNFLLVFTLVLVKFTLYEV